MKKTEYDVDIFMDCGAPSLYNRLARIGGAGSGVHAGAHFKDRVHDDHSYIKRPEYIKYRDDYAAFVKKHKTYLTVYSNLDVINNPEATWENQKYLESKGIQPIPVFHLGNDTSWLKMYIEKGYDYIALGGITPNPASVVMPILDKLWRDLLTDKNGYPIVKIHGFALTSHRLMWRYPWWSVDSTSWTMTGRYGFIYVPKTKRGKYDYRTAPLKVAVSSQSPERSNDGVHIDNLSIMERERVIRYINEKGFELGESTFTTMSADYQLKENERWVGKAREKNIAVQELKKRIW